MERRTCQCASRSFPSTWNSLPGREGTSSLFTVSIAILPALIFPWRPRSTAVSRPGPKRSRPLFEKYLASVPEPTKSLAAYFEGRVLESEGKHREAAEKFRLARELDRSRPEPVDRLLASLRASGQTEEAERLQTEEEP